MLQLPAAPELSNDQILARIRAAFAEPGLCITVHTRRPDGMIDHFHVTRDWLVADMPLVVGAVRQYLADEARRASLKTA